MFEMVACFGIWLGICGHIERVVFTSGKQCLLAVAEVKRSSSLQYAYCRPKVEDKA